MKNILPEIINRAHNELVARNVAPQEDTRSPQQKAVDEFFSKERFGCHDGSARELLEKVFGLKPSPAPTKELPPLFSIVYCGTNKGPWILLNGKTGFRSVDANTYHYENGCERIATIEEAQQFIESLKTVDAIAFAKWILKNGILLPDDILFA